MSLQTRLAEFISAVGGDIKTIQDELTALGGGPVEDVIRTADYSGAGDDQGIMYLLGTEGGAYANPVPLKVSVTATPYAVNMPVVNAFDRTTTTYYHSDGSGNDFVQWDFGIVPNRKVKVRHYQYRHRHDQAAHMPRSWKLQGSDDGVTWSDLDSRTSNTDINAAGAVATWAVTAEVAYRFIRFRLTAVSSNGTWYLNPAELELFGDVIDPGSAPDPNAIQLVWESNGDDNGLFYHLGSGGGLTAFSNPVPSAVTGTMSSLLAAGAEITQASNRTDDTQPAQTGDAAQSWMMWDLKDRRLKPTRYTLRGRNPGTWSNYTRSWVFEVSDDATTWTTLDTRTNDTSMGDTAKARWASYNVTTTPTKGYRYLRIRQIGTESSGANYLLINEAEFYGELTVPEGPTFPSGVKKIHGPFTATFDNVASGASAQVTNTHNLNIPVAKTSAMGAIATLGWGEALSWAFAADSVNAFRVLVRNNQGSPASGVLHYYIVELA